MRLPAGWTAAAWVVGVAAADQWSKQLVRENLALHEAREVIPGFFNLVHIENTGVAFGLFAGLAAPLRHVFFLAVALAAVVILFFAFRHFVTQGRVFAHALGLIGGGAVGNLVDRVRLGAVTDFLDLYVKGFHWPAFNLADSAITVGVALFLVGGLVGKEHRPPRPS